MNPENIAIAVIVCGAALYLLQWLYRSLIRPASKGGASPCESCPECETAHTSEKASMPHKH